MGMCKKGKEGDKMENEESAITEDAQAEVHNLSGFFCSVIYEKNEKKEYGYCPLNEFSTWLGVFLE